MNAAIRGRGLLVLILALAFCSLLATAQDMAVLASFKGTVLVRRESGQTQRATGKERLFPGDEVRTNADGSASIMYYTGKEVHLSANQKHLLAKEVREEGFLSRLGKAFSNLLWSKEPPKSVLGATRSFGAVKRITGITPCYTVPRDSVIKFTWSDSKAETGSRYVVSILNSEGTVVKSATVKDTDEMTVPLSSLQPLTEKQVLRWHVLAMKAGQVSEEISFSVLSDSEMRQLRQDLVKIADLCSGDTTAYRRPLLEAMLYVDRGLFTAAEVSLMKVVQEKPNLAIGHELLGDVYAKIGKAELALAEKKLAQTLSAPE